MVRYASSLGLLAALALAGCDKGPSVKMTNASVDQVMNQQAAAVKMKPGEWEVTAEVADMKMTGAPAGMPQPQQTKVVTKNCLTPEQVEKPTAMFGQGMQQFKNSCVYDTFEMKGGKLEAKMHCDTPGGQKVTANTEGSFSETSMSSETESTVSGLPNGMTMSSKTKISGKRLGECKAPASAG